MGDKSTVHRLALELADADRGQYHGLDLTLARHPSETVRRLAARALAFALFHRQDLAFTAGLCDGEEPAAKAVDGGGRVLLWLEVGQPRRERLDRAARHAERVALLTWDDPGAYEGLERVAVAALDPAFLDAAGAALGRRARWQLTVSGGELYLSTGDGDLSASLSGPGAGPEQRAGSV